MTKADSTGEQEAKAGLGVAVRVPVRGSEPIRTFGGEQRGNGPISTATRRGGSAGVGGASGRCPCWRADVGNSPYCTASSSNCAGWPQT